HRHWVGGSVSIPETTPPSNDVLRVLVAVDRDSFSRYGELTGQPQGWALFAPKVAEQFAFLLVELRWDDLDLEPGSVPVHDLPPQLLTSENAPADMNRFFRYQHFRLRRYEMQLIPAETVAEVFFDADTDREQVPASLSREE